MTYSTRQVDSLLSRISFPDTGRVVETRRTMTIITDIRDTPFGPHNFGRVLLGPERRVTIQGTAKMNEQNNDTASDEEVHAFNAMMDSKHVASAVVAVRTQAYMTGFTEGVKKAKKLYGIDLPRSQRIAYFVIGAVLGCVSAIIALAPL